jgi:tetratricopeptide (TPR) repeat protein
VIADGRKYIDLPLPESYDLKADPSERQNLFSGNSDEVRRLRRLIPPESAIDASARSEPDSEEVSRLRSLGYLSGGAAVKSVYTVDDDPKRLVGLNRDVYRCVVLYQSGNLRGAIALSRRVVEQRPAMPLAYANLAFLLRRAGDTADALKVYRAAVARGIADDELLRHYGLALCEVGRAREAVDVLQPLSGSVDPAKRNALGIALADAGRMAEAQAAFQGALRLDPENVEAQENMGIVLLRSGDLSGARDWFLKTLEIDQRTPKAWNGLGVAQARLGDERGAIDSWSRAVELDPTMYDALFNLGLTAAKIGLADQARDALQRFASAAPRSRYAADIEKAKGILRTLGVAG